MSHKTVNKKLTVFSLFTGAGGLDIGFEVAGFKVIGASDIWEESAKTMARNFPKVPFICKDIRQIEPDEILAATGGLGLIFLLGGLLARGFQLWVIRIQPTPEILCLRVMCG